MGIIDTATKELLPFRSTLWDLNLGRVGGVTRIYGADIAPDDSYFVVTSGSGGDAPPISDTVVAYPLNATSLQDSDVQPLWISRHFDSIYSVAITEQAVYVGGHFGFIESPESCPTRPATPGSRTSATAPARASRATGSATPSSAATTSPRSRPTTGERSSGTRSRTPSRATRPWRPPRAACSSAATACSRAVSAPVGSASTTSTRVAFPAAAAGHHDHHSDRGPRRREQHAVHDHRHRAGHHRHRRPGPGADPGPRQRPVPPGQRHRVHHRSPAPPTRLNATLAPGTGTTRTWSSRPGHEHHHQPQPAGLRPGVHGRHGRHGRLDQGGEVVRVVQHRGPDADDQHHRAERHPDLDHLHDDRHGERRQGRQLAELLVP